MKNKINYKNIWLRLWNILLPVHKEIKLLVLITLFFELIRVIGPYILKIIIDSLIGFNTIENNISINFNELKPIIFLIILMFAVEQLVSIFSYFKDKKVFKILISIDYFLPLKAQSKLLELSLGYHEKENTGNKIIKIERGVYKILDLIGNISWEVMPTIIQMIITFVVLLFIDFRFALIFLFYSPIFVFLTYKVNSDLYPHRKYRHKKHEEAAGKMVQSIININTVKSFTQEDRELNDLTKLRNIIKEKSKLEWSKLLKFGLGRNLVIDMGRITILLLGVYFVYTGSLTIGTLVFVITLSEKAFFSLYRLSRFYDRMEEGAEAVNRFINLSNEKTTIINPENGIKTKKISGIIKFKDVEFSYENNSLKALKNINLTINTGMITALVGPSGGGKTTVAKMIYRHYDPNRGEILIDGINLKDYDLYNIRKYISIVPQEVEIFNEKVKNNISYAKPSASEKEIISAARIANADEFILNLPEKYETYVGERGIKLSGGQRQRIGIARAILANPKIIIFDEATSNLDSYSEKLIQDALLKISKNRTMIIIAHRLSTIKKADKIYVLENGMIAEEGNHLTLSKYKKGLYAKLIHLQKMGDIN